MNHDYRLVPLFFMVMTLLGCGGGGSSSGNSTANNIPISVSVQSESFTAGVPKGFVYTVPAPSEAYTDVTIDINTTLEAANITITPTQ